MQTIGVKVIPARQQAAGLKHRQRQDNAAPDMGRSDLRSFQVHQTLHDIGKGTVSQDFTSHIACRPVPNIQKCI